MAIGSVGCVAALLFISCCSVLGMVGGVDLLHMVDIGLAFSVSMGKSISDPDVAAVTMDSVVAGWNWTKASCVSGRPSAMSGMAVTSMHWPEVAMSGPMWWPASGRPTCDVMPVQQLHLAYGPDAFGCLIRVWIQLATINPTQHRATRMLVGRYCETM